MKRSLYRLASLLLRATGSALLAGSLLGATPATSQTLATTDQHDFLVRSTDGTVLAVHEWGDRAKPTIILIHGYLQSYLAWQRQFAPLAHHFHVVAFDLRGHGGSDKPLVAEAYREAWRWADDVAAVIRASGATRPVLVGWSMGGRVILDYVQRYGQDNVGAFAFVDSGLKRAPGMASTANGKLITELQSANLADSIDATRAFLQGCFFAQPDPAAFDEMMAYNMVVPPIVRTYLTGRPLDFDGTLGGLSRPTLVIQGEKDALVTVAAAQYTVHQVPGAALVIYPGVGHSSFYEAADRFNSDLMRFVDSLEPALK